MKTKLDAAKQNAAQLNAVLQAYRDTPGTCYLCSQPSDVVGVFAPHDSQAFGAPVGKDRYIITDFAQTATR